MKRPDSLRGHDARADAPPVTDGPITGVTGAPDAPGPSGAATAALVARIADGDELAMRTCFATFESRVFGLATRLLGPGAEAEEALVDVFEKVWLSADSFDPARGTVAAWIGAIARSTCTDRLRAGFRVGGSLDGAADLAATTADPARASETEEWSLCVQRALLALPAEQRIPLCAAYFDGLTYREVATACAQPIGTVKTRIRAGLAGLRAALQPYHREETTP
jgi:RNA polymerase sigma-70 factor (ECF subfamily)